jgi:UDP-N-acetylmuramoylalanine--D-glutamate ligase
MGGKINVVVYGARDEHLPCVYCEGGAIVSGLGGKPRKVVEIAALKVSGMHNAENAAAATALARAVDIGFDAIADGLRAFEGLPHRLLLVGEYDGVKYYNDSKSTTAESILTAISAFEGNVHLIAGGRDKGCEFAVVNEMLETHVKNVFLIGEAAQRMQAVWRRHARVVREKSLEAAVADARGHAAAGDVVLFSPGCSSFDMFRDYEQRGEAFVALVRGVRAPERAEG